MNNEVSCILASVKAISDVSKISPKSDRYDVWLGWSDRSSATACNQPNRLDGELLSNLLSVCRKGRPKDQGNNKAASKRNIAISSPPSRPMHIFPEGLEFSTRIASWK